MSLDDLVPWSELAQREWPNLLLGNGFSKNIDDRFSYRTLVRESDLPDEARQLFTAVGSEDFEKVMHVLAVARSAALALGLEDSPFIPLYDRFREALITSVRNAHPPASDLPVGLLPYVGRHLSAYHRVFTTNYDLLPYWATMEAKREGGTALYDSFQPRGDGGSLTWRRDLHAGDSQPSIYFLHGALHLGISPFDVAVQKVQAQTNVLLDEIFDVWKGGLLTPLFVSEGDAKQKKKAIDDSRYLTACLRRLESCGGGLVVLGHSLGDVDDHIRRSIRQRREPLAISVFGSESEIKREVARLSEEFDGLDVAFFSSAEHPLTDPALQERPTSGHWAAPAARLDVDA